MKLLKTLKSFFLFSFLFSVFFITNANAQECTECDTISWSASQTRDIIYPEHPGCTVRVTFKSKGCNDVTEILLQKVAYIGGSSCSTLYAKFNSANYADQLWLFDRAYDVRIEQLFIEHYWNTNPILRGQYECPNGLMTYRTYKGACVNIIIDTWYYHPYTLPRISWFFCDDIACCMQKVKLCYNTTTQLVEVTEIDEYIPSEQDCTDTELPPPPSGSTQTGCIPWCQSNN